MVHTRGAATDRGGRLRPAACEIAGRLGDLVIATEPRTELLPALRPL
ncbi:hypothetical protein ACWCYK_26325 [Streptomyces lydicamycinicus]